MARAAGTRAYTEAHHTVYADIQGAEPVTVESRRFLPDRISVTYDWRSHVNDAEWSPRLIVLTGPWIDADGAPTGTGSGNVYLPMGQAPQWAQDFVTAHRPRIAVVEP